MRGVPPTAARLAAFIGLVGLLAACAGSGPAAAATPNGLVALVAGPDGVHLLGWATDPGSPTPIALPDGDTTWIATGRADVLAATLADGSVATSDPVRLGATLDWRTVQAVGPDGVPVPTTAYFATWDPGGGRYATLDGDLASGNGVHVTVTDPTSRTALEIAIDRSVLAAPPTWIGSERIVVVTGDSSAPSSVILATTGGGLTDGPDGSRLLAASANGQRVATMAGRGAPVVIHDTTGWLDSDGSSLASIDPPDKGSTAIALALDDDGQRVAIAWSSTDGSVSLAVHDAASGWRRIATPEIGPARGAVVAWRRGR